MKTTKIASKRIGHFVPSRDNLLPANSYLATSKMSSRHELSDDVGSLTQVEENLSSHSQVSLMQSVQMNTRVLRFLQITANYWPSDHNGGAIFHKMYYLLVRGILICAVAFSLYYFVEEIKHGNEVGIFIALTFFLDIVSVVPTQYINQKRLNRDALIHDHAVFGECTNVAEKFLLICMSTIIISIGCGAQDQSEALAVAGLTISEVCVVLYLNFNLWFLLVDLKVSNRMIDEMLLLADKKQLTIAKFNQVRSDIDKRVKESKWVSDFILLPCVASVASIVVLMFHVKPGTSHITYTIGWTSALIKEMIFICVAFCFVATVNQKADDLTEKLSCEVWLPSQYSGGRSAGDGCTCKAPTSDPVPSTGGKISSVEQHSPLSPPAPTPGAPMNDQVCCCSCSTTSPHSDIERLTMCVSSLTRPISFTLLFKRVSWQNVVVSFAGVALTISIGLTRSLIMEI